MEESRLTSRFEQFQFNTTRIIAIVIAILAWTVIVGVIVAFIVREMDLETHVTLDEVQPVSTSAGDNGKPAAPATTYRMPENLKDFFGGDNDGVLKGWLENLDDSQQQDFLNNLSQLVAQSHKEPTAELVNTYKDLKLKRIGTTAIDKYQRIGEVVAGIATVVAALFLVILASLVLVLLAIERNTRGSAPAPAPDLR
jgi:hypothetical protein